MAPNFRLLETTIDDIHRAYKSGQLTSRQLVQMYLDRIEAYDKKGPTLNAIITINSQALEEADRLDAAFKASGLVGPLHGIPVIIKDQADAKGRPATWNSVAGMRPTAGLVSRGGVYAGWPEIAGSLGPMARTIRDLAILLDAMVGYDPEDPLTSKGVGHVPDSYTKFLDKSGLKGARIGILRESIGHDSEPESEDFKKIVEVFDKAVAELKAAG